jgi:hypothetical protein
MGVAAVSSLMDLGATPVTCATAAFGLEKRPAKTRTAADPGVNRILIDRLLMRDIPGMTLISPESNPSMLPRAARSQRYVIFNYARQRTESKMEIA